MSTDYELSEFLGKEIEELHKTEMFMDYFQGIDIEEITGDYYLTNEQKGIGLIFNNNKVLENIQLYSGNKDEVKKFLGKLPLDIDFDDKLELIEKKTSLESFESGGGEELPFIGKTNPWRKYFYDDCYLHFEINENNTINLLTIGKA